MQRSDIELSPQNITRMQNGQSDEEEKRVLITYILPIVCGWHLAGWLSTKFPSWWGAILAVVISTVLTFIITSVSAMALADYLGVLLGAALAKVIGVSLWLGLLASILGVRSYRSRPKRPKPLADVARYKAGERRF